MDWKDVLKNDVEKGLLDVMGLRFPNQEAKEFYQRELQNAIHWGGNSYAKKAFTQAIYRMPKANRTIEGMRLVLKEVGSPAHGVKEQPVSSPSHDAAMAVLEEQRNPTPTNFGAMGSDPARHLTNPYKKMLKGGSKPMKRWGPIIDEIMSDGNKRTPKGVLDSLYNYQNDKRASTRNIPTNRAISTYLNTSSYYINMGKTSYGTEYRLKDTFTKLMKGMETATRSAELHAMNDFDLYQSILGYIKSLVNAGNDKTEVLSMLSQWLPNIMVHNSNFMEELQGYGEIDAISDVEWANVAENFSDYIDDFVEDLQ